MLRPSGSIGIPGKLNLIHSYRNLSRIRDSRNHLQLPNCALAEFLSQADKERISPEPVGVVKRRGGEEEMNLSKYLIGDRYAAALSKGIKCLPKLSKLNMSGNRLSDKGAQAILAGLNPACTKTLDLSYNSLSIQTVDMLATMMGKPLFRLEVLHLEGNKLRDRGVAQLLKALTDCDSLQELNLSKTSLGDNGAIAVGSYLKDSKQLRKLDLHWNLIKAVGGSVLFKGLACNTSLKVLDVSWNALCHPQDFQIGTTIAAAFRKHPNLYHVDLSHNQLSEEDCAAVNCGLSENHSIAGIHMQGNDAKVDALGFVNPKGGCSVPSEAHVFVRILGESPASSMWRPSTNCWLCEGWSEVEFLYSASQVPPLPVYLHLSFEAYAPYLLTESSDGVLREYRMCPPGEVRFFFTEGSSQRTSPNYPTCLLAVPLLGPFEYSEEVRQSGYVDVVNTLLVRKSRTLGDLHLERRAKPRPVVRKRNSEEVKPTWTLPISVFREYKFEDEDLLSRCFEFDWEHSKLPKLLKYSDETNALKLLLWKHYKGFKETYKYFSCFSPQGYVFCIALNAFTDLCTQCGLASAMKLSDIDFQFKATNYTEVRSNPRNPTNALIRHQFMEIFVRLAVDKYVKTGLEKRPSVAVERLINEHLEGLFERFDANRWRWSRYLTEDCDKVFKAHLPILQLIFQTNSRLQVKPGQRPFMSLPEFQLICASAGLLNETFASRDIDFCFNLSMMTQVDEVDSERHCQMSLVEFLEALGRVAEMGKYAGQDQALHLSLTIITKKLVGLCPRTVREKFQQGRDVTEEL